MTTDQGSVKILTIYVDDGDRHNGRPVHEALLELFLSHRISGATLFRGIAGYGSDKVFHTPKLLRLTEDMPLKIEVIETDEKIQEIIPEVKRIVEKGIVTMSDAVVVHAPEK